MNDDSGYELLANAIIAQACRDYKARLMDLENERQESGDEKKIKGIESSIKAIENFFNGAWFAQLSGGDVNPEYIMKRLRREAYEGKRR